MKDRVDGTEGFRESKSKRVGTGLSEYLEWTKIFLRKFLRGVSCPEVVGFNKYLLSNFKFKCQSSSGIVRLLISFLSGFDFSLENFVQFVQIDGEFSGSGRGKVTFQMYGDVWMVALVCEERGDTSSCTRGIVVGEFRDRE
jgi:hypothetical protein